MNRTLDTAQPRETARPSRRALRLALAAPALAGLVGAAIPRPASAAATHITMPLQLDYTKLHANTTSGEWGADEPYVVLYVADLSQPGVVALTLRTTFQKMSKGDTDKQPTHLWATTGGRAPIADTDDVLVLAALMEHDSSDPEVIQNNVDSRVRNTLAANRSLSRTSLVSKLRTEMDVALDQAAQGASGNDDDRIGGTKSLELTPGNVLDASNGSAVPLKLRFSDGHANYDATFTLSR